MLVLTRKEGEKILIGEDIILTVVMINRGNVRIGIEAPKSVPILREELEKTAYPTKGVDHVEAKEQPVGQPQEEQQAKAK